MFFFHHDAIIWDIAGNSRKKNRYSDVFSKSEMQNLEGTSVQLENEMAKSLTVKSKMVIEDNKSKRGKYVSSSLNSSEKVRYCFLVFFSFLILT